MTFWCKFSQSTFFDGKNSKISNLQNGRHKKMYISSTTKKITVKNYTNKLTLSLRYFFKQKQRNQKRVRNHPKHWCKIRSWTVQCWMGFEEVCTGWKSLVHQGTDQTNYLHHFGISSLLPGMSQKNYLSWRAGCHIGWMTQSCCCCCCCYQNFVRSCSCTAGTSPAICSRLVDWGSWILHRWQFRHFGLGHWQWLQLHLMHPIHFPLAL